MRLAGIDVSLFVNNLFDANPWLGMSHSTYYDPQQYKLNAIRPRTFGLTVTYRQ